MKNPDSPLSQSITSHSSDPTIIKKSDYYTYHSRPCLSYFKKGVFSMQEGHVLKCRRACSQIQKGPFFCLNTHASCSCGAKQIYIKIKYSSPHMPSILPTHFPSSPNPHPSHPHSTHLPFPAHSPSVCSPLSFRPQPTPRPSPTHSPLSVTPRTCSSVTLSLLAYNLFSRPLLNSSTYNVTHRTCSPVTMSINTTNLRPYPLVNPSSCKLFLSSYFFVGTCPKHCNANSSLFVTHFYLQKHNYQ